MIRHTIVLTGFFLIIISIAACKKEKPAYVFGPASATGTLLRADTSLLRRGSHLLIVHGERKFYVESKTTNLSDYEGRTVFVSGNLEPNTVKDLPVLVMKEIAGPANNEDLKRFEISSLGVRLGLPVSWKASIEKNITIFSLKNEEYPLMTIRSLSGTSLPTGNLMYIKNRRASRINTPPGASDIYILEKNSILQIHFDASLQSGLRTKVEGDQLLVEFERVLSSISFIRDKDLTTPSIGSGSLKACGVGAELVCDAGYFCNITDFEHRIGECRKQ